MVVGISNANEIAFIEIVLVYGSVDSSKHVLGSVIDGSGAGVDFEHTGIEASATLSILQFQGIRNRASPVRV